MTGRFYGWIIALIVMLSMGCASSSAPPSYYGLHAMANQSVRPVQNALTIGVGPVQLPDYLDRTAIVTRLNPNRLQINTGHRWAGSLQSEILRVLAANLKSETAARQVTVFPWGSDFEPDARFRVSIHSFEGRLAHQILLKATWSLIRSASEKSVLTRDSEVVEAISGESFEALAEAMGRALAVMSRDMAAALDPVENGNAPITNMGQR